jgi:hypothetical protein
MIFTFSDEAFNNQSATLLFKQHTILFLNRIKLSVLCLFSMTPLYCLLPPPSYNFFRVEFHLFL